MVSIGENRLPPMSILVPVESVSSRKSRIFAEWEATAPEIARTNTQIGLTGPPPAILSKCIERIEGFRMA